MIMYSLRNKVIACGFLLAICQVISSEYMLEKVDLHFEGCSVSTGGAGQGCCGWKCYGETFFDVTFCEGGSWINVTGAVFGMSHIPCPSPISCCPAEGDCRAPVVDYNSKHMDLIYKKCNGRYQCDGLQAEGADDITGCGSNTSDYEIIYYDCLSGNITGFEYESGARNVHISWDKVVGAEGYIVVLDGKEIKLKEDEVSHNFTSLTPGTEYDVYITACTGCSDSSPIFGLNFSSPVKTKLDSPIGFTITDKFYKHINVSWANPEGQDCNYTVHVGEAFPMDICEGDRSGDLSRTCNIEGNDSGRLQIINITAEKDGYEMIPCFDCELQTIAIPAPPLDFKATHLSDATSVELSWAEPEDGIFTMYDLSYDGKNQSIGRNETSWFVEDLASDKKYEFYLTSVSKSNGLGDAYSDPKSLETYTYSKPVRQLAIQYTNSSSLTVTWEKPANDGGDDTIRGYYLLIEDVEYHTCIYSVELSTRNKEVNSTLDLNCTQHDKAVIPDMDSFEFMTPSSAYLLACSRYNVTVVAVSEAGDSQPQTADGETTEGAPDPVRDLKVIPDKNILHVVWERPEKPERCNITYTVQTEYKNCNDDSDAIIKTIHTENTSLDFNDGIISYWNYSVRVVANVSGLVSESRTENTRTLLKEPGKPSFTIDSEIQTPNCTTILLKLPGTCERNGPIDGYQVNWTCHDLLSNHEPDHRIMNITRKNQVSLTTKPYRRCEVLLAAYNEDERGEKLIGESYFDEFETPQDIPGVVSMDSINSNATSNNIELKWKPPEEPNGPIVNYTITYQNLGYVDQYFGGNAKEEPVIVETEHTCIDVPTRPFSKYTFRIFATNKIGTCDSAGDFKENTTVGEPYNVGSVNLTVYEKRINVSWELPERRTGPTNYTINFTDLTFGGDFTEKVEGFNSSNILRTERIKPYRNYSVIVSSKTKAGVSPSNPVIAQTLKDVPGSVSQPSFDMVNKSCTRMIVNWTAIPKEEWNDGEIDYIVQMFGGKNEHSTTFPGGAETYHEVVKVSAETKYTLMMITVNNTVGNGLSFNISESIYTGSCIPYYPEGEKKDDITTTIDEAEDQGSTESTIVVKLKTNFFTNESNGRLTYKGLAVCEEERCGDYEKGHTYKSIHGYKNNYSAVWWQYYTNDAEIAYYRMNLTGINFKSAPNTTVDLYDVDKGIEYVLGGDMSCDTFRRDVNDECNGPLKPGTSYRVKSIACTLGGCLLTHVSAPMATKSPSLGLPVIIVLSSVIPFVIVSILFTVLMTRILRKRRKKPEGDAIDRDSYDGGAVDMDHVNDAAASTEYVNVSGAATNTDHPNDAACTTDYVNLAPANPVYENVTDVLSPDKQGSEEPRIYDEVAGNYSDPPNKLDNQTNIVRTDSPSPRPSEQGSKKAKVAPANPVYANDELSCEKPDVEEPPLYDEVARNYSDPTKKPNVPKKPKKPKYKPNPARTDSPTPLPSEPKLKKGKVINLTVKRDVLKHLSASMREDVEQFMMDVDGLDYIRSLGKGHFGTVYLCKLLRNNESQMVAIKSLKGGGFSKPAELKAFFEEALKIKDFRNNNILSPLGIVLHQGSPKIVLPYMEKGDLKSLLLKKISSNELFDLLTLVRFCRDVASGMSYLSRQKFAHMDLAARNCMVDNRLVVKVGDFGMTHDLYEKSFYKMSDEKPLPIRWMSPESILNNVFTCKSDVWSYGVVMWEIFTHGEKPYKNLDNNDIITSLSIHQFVLLENPMLCPPIIYSLMCECWSEDPEARPRFSRMKTELEAFIK